MDQKDRLFFYQTIYYKEFERRDRINSRIFWSFSFISALLGALSYILNNCAKIKTDFYGFLFGLCLCVTIVLLIISIIYLIRAFSKYTYGYLPDSQKLEGYWNELDNYYNNNNEKGTARNDFANELIQTFCLINDKNFSNNAKRTKYVHKATTAIDIAIFTLAFTFLFSNINIVNKVYCLVTEPVKHVFSQKRKEVKQTNVNQRSASTKSSSKTNTATSTMVSGKRGIETTTTETFKSSKPAK